MRAVVRLVTGDVIEMAGSFSDEALFYAGGILIDSSTVVAIQRVPSPDAQWNQTISQLQGASQDGTGHQVWFPGTAIRYLHMGNG